MSTKPGQLQKRGAREAVQRLSGKLQFEAYSYVVEADIKGFFDHIDHQWLIRMLELRIDDGAFLGLIKKWLKAGILLPEGMVEHPEAGTPQGGLVSPILANVYLHYALDLWFERVVKRQCRRGAYLCRYADDFVAIFDCEEDAKWFHEQLASRLAKFHLEVAAEKTRVIRFSRDSGQAGSRFDFLGFEFR